MGDDDDEVADVRGHLLPHEGKGKNDREDELCGAASNGRRRELQNTSRSYAYYGCQEQPRVQPREYPVAEAAPILSSMEGLHLRYQCSLSIL
ncbi:hypothetical protein L7F22_064223 [Adiantum nelumboides]|nr:hypothetical protein [Adiantum nelumboides]